jgi:hypothetical protein
MKSLTLLIIALATFSLTASAQTNKTQRAELISTNVVINEIYGGAGCGTAGCSTYQNDFVELRNISMSNINIGGWSFQYAAATGTAWQVTAIPAGIVLRPGDRYLIAESFGANGANPLPPPNLTGTIAMSATAFKAALVSTTTALTGACPFPNAAIVDFIGFGATANCNSGGTNNTATNAPAGSTTLSDNRNAAGTDTDIDSADFTTASPTPQPALLPTAANASISGRVLTGDGRGISKTTVTLVDSAGNARTYVTNAFGYYTFDALTTGETYVLSVSSKQYDFNPSSKAVSLEDNLTDADFTAQP